MIGVGQIGGTLARLLVGAGHEVAISSSRGPETLAGLVEELGGRPAGRNAATGSITGGVMDNSQIHGTIEQLVAEEHELWKRESVGNASEDDRRRLEALRVSLDQCWDLLRQRRALREFGLDADAAAARSPEVVEHYEQ